LSDPAGSDLYTTYILRGQFECIIRGTDLGVSYKKFFKLFFIL